MRDASKLMWIKILHTIIWLGFNIVIGYMLYAVISDKVDRWVWTGLGLFIFEGLILLAFRWNCPLTIIARKYSSSTKDNFDICLPNWLARYTKTIYSILLGIVIIILIIRISS